MQVWGHTMVDRRSKVDVKHRPKEYKVNYETNHKQPHSYNPSYGSSKNSLDVFKYFLSISSLIPPSPFPIEFQVRLVELLVSCLNFSCYMVQDELFQIIGLALVFQY